MYAKYVFQGSFINTISPFVFQASLPGVAFWALQVRFRSSAVDGVPVHPDHSEPRLRTLEKREKEFFLIFFKKAVAPYLEGLPPQNPVLRYVVVLKLEANNIRASFPSETNPTNQPGTPRPSAWRRSPLRP